MNTITSPHQPTSWNPFLSLLLLLLLSTPSQSFLPPLSTPVTSTFTSSHRHSPPRTPFLSRHPPSPSNSPTSLYNLFDRFARVAKSNLNNIAKKLEDPEKIMTQALEDMQCDLVKVRQSYAEVTASVRRLTKEMDVAVNMSAEWRGRAETALKAGEEELAKEALQRRQVAEEKAEALKSQIAMQEESLGRLKEGMEMLEGKILESKAKKEQMVARARTAQSTKAVNDLMSGVSGQGSVDAWERMEEKVEALEAAAEVAEDFNKGYLGPGGSTEEKFKALESKSKVDDELEAMKKMLGGGGEN